MSPVSASSRTSDQPAASRRSGSCGVQAAHRKPLAAIRASRSGPGRGSASAAIAFAGLIRPRSASASRTISTFSAAPSVRPGTGFASTASAPPSRTSAPERMSVSRAPATAPTRGPADGNSISAIRMRLLGNEGGAVLADPFLVEPLSQAGSPPSAARRGSRTGAGRRFRTRSRRPSAPAPRPGPGSRSRPPCRAIRRRRDRRRAPPPRGA